jgi:hypothetical protein
MAKTVEVTETAARGRCADVLCPSGILARNTPGDARLDRQFAYRELSQGEGASRGLPEPAPRHGSPDQAGSCCAGMQPLEAVGGEWIPCVFVESNCPMGAGLATLSMTSTGGFLSAGGDMDAEIFSDVGVAAVLKHVTAAKVLEFGIRWSAHLEKPLLVGLLCRCKAAAREQEEPGTPGPRGTTQRVPLFPRPACRSHQRRPAGPANDRHSPPHPCFRLSLRANRFALLGKSDMDEPEARRCQRCARPMGTCDARWCRRQIRSSGRRPAAC